MREHAKFNMCFGFGLFVVLICHGGSELTSILGDFALEHYCAFARKNMAGAARKVW